MGKIVVVTDSSATVPEEYVQDGVNGYLVRVGDAKGMADRILRLVQDEAFHRKFSDAAYDTRFRFSVAESAVAFERALVRGCERRASEEV